jgi:hypothetical protein
MPAKHPFIHGSISWAPTDQINSEKALEICSEVVKTVMPNDRPVLFVVHGDTTHFHIHFLAGTVSSDGLIHNKRFDFRLWESAMEMMEQRYQFASVLNRKSEAKKQPNREPLERRPSQAEYQYEERTGKESDRRVLKRLIDAAILNAKTIADFQDALIRDGIEIKLNQSKTGHVSGISYEFRDFYFKGSSLGKKYAYKEISNSITNHLETALESEKESEILYKSARKLNTITTKKTNHDNLMASLSTRDNKTKHKLALQSSGNDLQLKATLPPDNIF